jgi:lipoprotein-anchoring transpeptidase ErfK/SrfK
MKRRGFLAGLAGAMIAPRHVFAAESWVQNHSPTTVWAEPEGGKALAPAPQWSHFRIAGATAKGRLPVFDPRLGATGWVDAVAVGPSGPPKVAAAEPARVDPYWVAPHRAVALLVDPREDAAALALLAQFGPLRVGGPGQAGYLPVEEPFAKVRGWVAAEAVGRVGEPTGPSSAHWWGSVVADEAVARAEPSRRAPVVATYPSGTKLGFSAWVEGEMVTWDDPAWGQVAPGAYVYGRATRPLDVDAPPLPRLASVPAERWIGVNRTLQLIVGYEGANALFWARTSTGRPGWETALGNFQIIRRVARETMDSRTLLGRDAARSSYRIENVRYTQYFTGDGNAIHENWWKEQDTFGLPSSHGCAGLRPEDAARFWEFGDVGMPVVVHT